jgi:Ca2+-binding RTX toxin-like protein
MMRRRRRSASSPEFLEERALLATITVTSLEDNLESDGEVTLREALKAANEDISVDGSVAGSGQDVIEFSSDIVGTIALVRSLGPLKITSGVHVQGLGADHVVIDGNGTDGFVVAVEAADQTVEFSGLHVTNAEWGFRIGDAFDPDVTIRDAVVSESGLGISLDGASHTIANTTVRDNRRGMRIRSGDTTIQDSQITDNTIVLDSRSTTSGAGILIETDGRVEILDSLVARNKIDKTTGTFPGATTIRGAGIMVDGNDTSELIVRDSTIVDNTLQTDTVRARGAGISIEEGTSLEIESSTISGNAIVARDGRGGAIYGDKESDITIVDSTVSSNRVTIADVGLAAGIYGGSVAVINSTLSGNLFEGRTTNGHALHVGDVTIANSTIVDHEHGVLIRDRGTITSSVFRNNTHPNCQPDLCRAGVDVDASRATVEFSNSFLSNNISSGLAPAPVENPDANGNMAGTETGLLDPKLLPLQDNGGSGLTHALASDSPLINAGANEQQLEFDQRGPAFPRSIGTTDIGAFESPKFLITINSAQVSEADGSVVFDIQLLAEVDSPMTFNYATRDITAEAGEDYAAVSGQLTFSTKDEVQQVTVDLIDDALPERTEQFALDVTSSEGNVDTSVGQVTIAGDEDVGMHLLPDGELLMRGTDADDIVTMSMNGDDLSITFNGTSKSYPLEEIAYFTFVGGNGDNDFRALAGLTAPFTVTTGSGDDFIETSAGPDHIETGTGRDYVFARADRDTIDGGLGGDTILGGSGADSIIGGNGSDSISGGSGDDYIVTGKGRDTALGEGGNDFISPDTSESIWGIKLFGGDGDDTLVGGGQADQLTGDAGNDVFVSVSGGDVAMGGAGDDDFSVSGAALVNGGGGNDTIEGTYSSDSGSPTLKGASGNDRLSGSGIIAFGGAGSDVLGIHEGTLVPSIAYGDAGNDVFSSSRNDTTDTLVGGSGHDSMTGFTWRGSPGDLYLGGDGNDTITGGDAHDTIEGGEGNDILNGDFGDDLIEGGEGNDSILGDKGHDTLIGNAGDDTLKGENGLDVLLGSAGNDRLIGSNGRDLFVGGSGSDTILGGNGQDLLIGGTTSLDPAALGSILDEWTSDRTLEVRAANIRDGSGSDDRKNSDTFLDSSTLTDDGDVDDLTGDAEIDWFFARADSDLMSDRSDNELFDEL